MAAEKKMGSGSHGNPPLIEVNDVVIENVMIVVNDCWSKNS